MRKRLITLALSLAALCLAVGPALAHDMWLTLDKPAKGKALHILVGYGHAFPHNEGTEKEKLVPAYIVGPKGKMDTKPGAALDFLSKAPLPKGSYLAVSGRKPQFYTKSPAGYQDKTKDQVPEATRCVLSAKYAKAVLNLGKPGEIAAKPVGQTLEVVPQVNPGAIKAGGELPVTVLFKGKPLGNAEVFGTFAGYSKHKNTFAFFGKTDKTGQTFVKVWRPGLWLVVAKHKVPYPDQAKCDEDMHAATLTFVIK